MGEVEDGLRRLRDRVDDRVSRIAESIVDVHVRRAARPVRWSGVGTPPRRIRGGGEGAAGGDGSRPRAGAGRRRPLHAEPAGVSGSARRPTRVRPVRNDSERRGGEEVGRRRGPREGEERGGRRRRRRSWPRQLRRGSEGERRHDMPGRLRDALLGGGGDEA